MKHFISHDENFVHITWYLNDRGDRVDLEMPVNIRFVDDCLYFVSYIPNTNEEEGWVSEALSTPEQIVEALRKYGVAQ